MVQLIPDKNSLASFIPLFTLSVSDKQFIRWMSGQAWDYEKGQLRCPIPVISTFAVLRILT